MSSSSRGLPAGEAAVFINYVNVATALIMDETGMTRKQAHAALMSEKRSAAVEDILSYMRRNQDHWMPK
jgi:hypothetical protein